MKNKPNTQSESHQLPPRSAHPPALQGSRRKSISGFFALIALLSLMCCSNALAWTLVWSDEFTASTIDTTKWGFDLGAGGWGNGELQTYTNTNAYIQNGELVIKAVKTGPTSYTSSRLKTQDKASWKYGKIQIRAKLPYSQGLWPAFWMLGTNYPSVGWPYCGEIDIMELRGGGVGFDDTIYGTLHWWDEVGNHGASYGSSYTLPTPQFFYQAYHVFEIEWNATDMIWRLDGVQWFTTSINTNLWPTMEEFQKPFSMIMNVAVGGNWPGRPNTSTVWPQYMYVDYVRVYQ